MPNRSLCESPAPHRWSFHQRVRAALWGLCLALLLAGPLVEAAEPQLREGDLVFQTSRCSQSEAIRIATHSRWSHVGLVVKHEGKLQVLEAVQPVRYTPVSKWIARGVGGHVAVRRPLKPLDATAIGKLQKVGDQYVGRNYDLAFDWSDDRIYCSELVWKVYQRALEVKLSPLRRMRDFDLSAPEVKSQLVQRYGANVPLDEQVVSPEDLFQSELLVTVFER